MHMDQNLYPAHQCMHTHTHTPRRTYAHPQLNVNNNTIFCLHSNPEMPSLVCDLPDM